MSPWLWLLVALMLAIGLCGFLLLLGGQSVQAGERRDDHDDRRSI